MAPATLDDIDKQLKVIVQNLYNLIVQGLDHQGPLTEEAMKREITSLITSLSTLSHSAPALPISIPPEVIEYVDSGRNPDIYTREFVELVQKNNQKLRGKAEAFAQFRDILIAETNTAMPDVRDELKRVAENTGGIPDGLEGKAAA